MLDIGWTELLVIAVILIVVVGPKDLPPMIRAFGKMTKRLRQTAGEFRAQFDEALREAELDDLKNSVNDIRSLNPANSLRETFNPLRQMSQEIKSDLERSTRPDAKPASPEDGYEEHSILPDVPLGLGEPPKELMPVVPQPTPAASSTATAPTAAVAAAAPATSAPAMVAPAAEKKTASRKPAAKASATVKPAAKPAKAAPAVPVAADASTAAPAKAAKLKPAAVKTAPAKAKAAAPAGAPVKAAPKTRKTKSEDRA